MNDRTLNIAQLNMARSMVVSVELRSYCISNAIDIAIVQEPYTRYGRLPDLEDGDTRVVKSHTNEQHGIWAAIAVFNRQLDIICRENLTTMHTVLSVAHPGQTPIDIISSYFQFRKETAEFVREITEINRSLSNRTIIGADVNAFSPWWHDPRRNDKGRLIERMISSLDLTVENRADSGWSFHGARGNSNVDLTLSRGFDGTILNWKMDQTSTSSDHSLITYSLTDQVIMAPSYRVNRFYDFKIDKHRLQDVLRTKISNNPVNENINDAAKNLTDAITETGAEVLPKRVKKNSPRPPWWNTDVPTSKTNLNREKRCLLREATAEARIAFNAARNAHVSNIRRAKFNLWKKFAEERISGNQTWGKLTKCLIRGRQELKVPTVLARQDGTYTDNLDDTIELMVKELIPHSEHDTLPVAQPSELRPATIELYELRLAVWRQKNRAPGADGISAKIIRAVWPVISGHLLSVINNCLTQEKFPHYWKHAHVVVLLKGKNKDPLKSKSYRPVNLLPVLGKILEEVICNKLEQDTEY